MTEKKKISKKKNNSSDKAEEVHQVSQPKRERIQWNVPEDVVIIGGKDLGLYLRAMQRIGKGRLLFPFKWAHRIKDLRMFVQENLSIIDLVMNEQEKVSINGLICKFELK